MAKKALPLAAANAASATDRFKVRSLRPAGFCRAGRRWSAEGETLARAELTEEQWTALEAEPLLSVTPAVEPAAEAQE